MSIRIYGLPQLEQFCAAKEKGLIPSDPYNVAVLRDGVVVCHVPRVILAVCSADEGKCCC